MEIWKFRRRAVFLGLLPDPLAGSEQRWYDFGFLSISFASQRFAAVGIRNIYNSLGFRWYDVLFLVFHLFPKGLPRYESKTLIIPSCFLNCTIRFLIIQIVLHMFAVARL